MRLIGTVADGADAKRLADYLLTLGITTRLDPSAGGVGIWVHHEDRVPQAKAELEAFQGDPGAEKYRVVATKAKEIRKKADRARREHEKQSHDVRYYWNSRDFRRCPVWWTLILVSVAVALWTNFGGNRGRVEPLRFADYHYYPAVMVPDTGPPDGEVVGGAWIRADPIADLRKGQFWRPITPIFLHFGLLHLFFNMSWIMSLGREIEARRGSWRFAGLVLFSGLASNIGQFLYSKVPFGGMSGVVMALFGYAWMKGLYDPEEGLGLHRNTVTLMIVYLAVTIGGGFHFAHAAHLVGLFTGMLVALAPHLVPGLRSGREPD